MFLFRILKAAYKSFRHFYSVYIVPQTCQYGFKGENAVVQVPSLVVKPKNLYMEENVSIGCDSIIFCPQREIHIKRNTYSGPRLFISTGNHYLKKGAFSRLLTHEDEKRDGVVLNHDVYIDEDVWLGANVSVLCHHVSRGAVAATGAVLKHDVPPYAIVGGYLQKY